MEIELKNGEKLHIEVNSLIFEYIADYTGGKEQLETDANSDNLSKKMQATNHLLYSIIASNYRLELTKRAALKLVKIEDIPEIIKFTNIELDKIKANPNFKI